MAAMPALTRPQKITFAEMRAAGVRGILIYCSDYKCSHSIAISADQWPDDVRIRTSGTGSAGAGASSTARARLAGVMFSMFAMGAWPGAATH
jgi:hypothetical protein